MKNAKKIVSIILSLVMVLGLFAACGQNPDTDTEIPQTNPTQVQTPTEVTIPSPVLSESLQQVYDLGIADMDLLSRAEDICTRAEAVDMLARVYEMRKNEKSPYLNDMVSAFDEDFLSKPATRYYFAQAIYYSDMVDFYFDAEYADWLSWVEYCDSKEWGGTWPDASLIGYNDEGVIGECGLWDCCSDMDKISAPRFDLHEALYPVEYGNFFAANYALCAYDRRDGNKIMYLDENNRFRPHKTMTIEQVAQTALLYYHYLEDEAKMVPYADTFAFDSSIITSELLAKETTLPDASCAKLPSEWRGTLIFNGRAPRGSLDRMPDKHYYEYEIQTVKDAGFNFVGITFDFSRLQGPEPQEGMLNEIRLKELDQVIAWCMERDIHVDLRCCGVGELSLETPFSEWAQWNYDAPNGTAYAEEFASLWKAIAQRYAEIPNCYLSFNLLVEPEVNSEQQYAAFFGPAVDAIREVDPDRCIIADIHCGGLTGKSMAEKGVALSYHAYDPREFCCLTLENQDDAEYLATVTWPFTASNGKTYDGAAVLDSRIPGSISANELAATAEEYGVGFMVGEWGIFGNGLTRNRYPDETIEAFLKDMANTLEEKGYGWCYGNFHYPYSIACFAPAVKTGDYVKVEGTPLYIEQKMMGWFQEINGIK